MKRICLVIVCILVLLSSCTTFNTASIDLSDIPLADLVASGVAAYYLGEDGTLYYRFTSNQAVQVNRYAGNALSAEDLAGLFAAIRQAGLQPIPRLYAFRDHAAAKMLTGARITLTGNSGWVG